MNNEKKYVKIIYEDEYILVVNKSAGIEVDSLKESKNKNENIITMLENENNFLSEDNIFLVHRIDKFTSGIVLIAKDIDTQKKLENMFREKTISKKYHAIVEGIVEKKHGTINLSIGINKKEPNKRIILPINKGGESAISHYKVLKFLNYHTLLELIPETGRTHQLRLHLASIKHPIIGDKIYSFNYKMYKMYGFALIAKSIHFTHPITLKEMSFAIDYNTEFLKMLKILSVKK